MTTPTRVVRKFDLVWRKRSRRWVLVERVTRSTRVMPSPKKEAVSAAARYVCDRYPSQLYIRTKAGRIEKGRNSERSYGVDSRRRPG